MKRCKGRDWRRGGFTMIELVSVIAILSILMAVAVPQMISYTWA